MIPVAVIVIVSVVPALTLAVSILLAVRLYRQGKQASTARRGANEDLESAADAPTRKVHVHQGRIVSWHSTTAAKVAKDCPRLPTPKIFSSRRSSIFSLPATVDLESEIAQFRKDYAGAKELEMEKAGSGNVNGLIPVTRLTLPRPASIKPSKVLSPIGETDDPMESLNQSSWATYNGHRKSDNPLSSPFGPLSASLEKSVEAQHLDEAHSPGQHSSPLQDKFTEALPSPIKEHDSTHAPAIDASFDAQSRATAPRRPKPLRLQTYTFRPQCSSPSSPSSASAYDPKSPAALSIQSAIYKSPIHELIPAAPQPRKPSKLDLRASFSHLSYTFPASRASSTVTSPTCASIISVSSAAATLGDDESGVSHPFSACSSLPQNSDTANLSRSRSGGSPWTTSQARRRSSSRRGNKRLPPIQTDVPVPPLPGHTPEPPTEVKPLDTGTFLASPTASELESSPPSENKIRRASMFSVTSSMYSAPLSPTFAVTPAFRVPLYTGKGTAGPKLRMISKKGTLREQLLKNHGELERRGSDGNVVQKPKKLLREQLKPSILRTYSQNAENMKAAKQAMNDCQVEKPAQHESAETTEHIEVASFKGERPQTSRSRSLANLRIRPVLASKRSASYNLESPLSAQTTPWHQPMRSSARVLSGATSSSSCTGSSDHKNLPPVPRVDLDTLPGVQRIHVSSLRTEYPGSSRVYPEPHVPTLFAESPQVSRQGKTARSHPTLASEAASLSSTYESRKRRSGLNRLGSAMALGKVPNTPNTPITPITPLSPASRVNANLAEAASISSKLASISGIEPKTPMHETGPKHNHNRTQSVVVIHDQKGSGKRTSPSSPAVSAISHGNTPDASLCTHVALLRSRTHRPWDQRSAVSPLSAEFPVGVQV